MQPKFTEPQVKSSNLYFYLSPQVIPLCSKVWKHCFTRIRYFPHQTESKVFVETQARKLRGCLQRHDLNRTDVKESWSLIKDINKPTKKKMLRMESGLQEFWGRKKRTKEQGFAHEFPKHSQGREFLDWITKILAHQICYYLNRKTVLLCIDNLKKKKNDLALTKLSTLLYFIIEV